MCHLRCIQWIEYEKYEKYYYHLYTQNTKINTWNSNKYDIEFII